MRTSTSPRIRGLGFKLLAALPCLLLFAAPGHAQSNTGPTSVFQLSPTNGFPGAPTISDCNYTGPGQLCDNWDLLNGPPAAKGNSLAQAFLPEPSPFVNFTTGGSKDPNPISDWAYTSTSTPNKDTLVDGYVAAYDDSVGDFQLIFGANRLSPNGDANIGIWFFQNSITLNGSGGFNGSHVNGDLFVISQFVTGGGVSVPAVYAWDSSCLSGVKNPTPGECADTNLKLLADPTSGICAQNAPYCAVTNSITVDPTWIGPLQSPLFFEGGIDVTKALAAVGITTLPCFSSFLEETRSSQSTSAVLKAFLLGPFHLCGMSLTKNCGSSTGVQPGVNDAGTEIVFPVSGVVTNTGIGTLYNVKVCDTIGSSTTPDEISVTNNTSGSGNKGSSTLGPKETGTWDDSSTSASMSETDSAFAVGTTSPSGTVTCGPTPGPIVSANTATPPGGSCSVTLSTSLSVTKTCTTSLVVTASDVQVQVAYSGTVCNEGGTQNGALGVSASEVTGVALTEYDLSATSGSAPTLSSTTLGPCDSFDGSGNCSESCEGLYDETKDTCVGADLSGACSTDACIPGNCANYSGSYVPTSDTPVTGLTGPGSGAGRYNFSDAVAVTSATAAVGSLGKVACISPATCGTAYAVAGATCPICPVGECTQ